jgi:hypothetical protein
MIEKINIHNCTVKDIKMVLIIHGLNTSKLVFSDFIVVSNVGWSSLNSRY